MIMLGLHAGPQNKGCNCLLCRLILRARSELTCFMKGLRLWLFPMNRGKLHLGPN